MRSSTSVLLLALPLLAFAPAREEVAFHVAAGTKLTKTFEQKLSVALDEMRMSQDGEDVPHDAMGDLEMKIESTTKVVFTDHYREMDEARPKVLARSFDELAGSKTESITAEGESQDETRDETSVLEGKTVVFTRAEGGDEYERKYEGEGADAELLENLAEDTDLRAFLPSRAVSEGDSWSIDAKEFSAIFDPGGDLALEAEEDEEGGQELGKELSANFEGKITATLKGFREEGEARVAVIALACDLKTHADDETEEEEVAVDEKVELELDLEGEILWSLKSGHASALTLSGEAKIKIAKTMTGTYGGEQFEFSQSMLFAGTTEIGGAWKSAE